MNKILHITLISLLIFPALHAQISEENLFISTDREVYFPEDEMYIKIWQNCIPGFYPSGLGYVELLSASNEIVSQRTIRFKRGGAGLIIQIPGTLPSGFYVLRAYTSWMKNYGPDFFANRKIMILNPVINNSFNFPTSKKYTGKTVRVNFYPEGGSLYRGVNNRVYVEFENLPANSLKGAFLTDEAMDTVAMLEELDKQTAYFDFVPHYGVYELRIPEIYPHKPFRLPQTIDLSARLNITASLNNLDFFVQKADTSLDFSSLSIEMQNINSRENKFADLKNLPDNPYIEMQNVPGGLNRILLKNENDSILSELYYLKEESQHLKIKRTEPGKAYSSRDTVNVELGVSDKNNLAVDAYLNIYVREKKENVLEQTDLRDFMAYGNYLRLKPGWDLNSEAYRSAISTMYGSSLFDERKAISNPEFTKEENEFILKGQYSNGRIENHDIFISFPGDSSEIFITKTDKDGRFNFFLPVNGERESFFKTRDTINKGFLLIEEPFYPEYIKYNDFPGGFDSVMIANFDKWYKSWRINNYFRTDRNKENNDRKTKFYDEADFYLSMDNYIDFPNMSEVFFEIVKPAMIFDQNKEPYLKIISRYTNRTIGDKPLYVIDGVPFTEPRYVMELDPDRVRDIAVIARRYFIGPQVFDGIVIINTNANNLSDLEPEMVFLRQDIVFPEPRTEFIIKPQPEIDNQPFDPIVACWISSAQCKKDGKMSFSFIAPDENGQYEIYIEAHDPDSRTFGSNTFDFQVAD